MEAFDFKFTVFTPTYNRANTLHRVYESLEAQTFRDFEWLIVDDGSTDGTRELVSGWMKTADFPIRYIYQQNSGKPTAMNRGAREAKGALFLTFDSDDRCKPNALETLYAAWEDIDPRKRNAFSAVTAQCEDEYGQLVGDLFPQDVYDSSVADVRYRHRVKGEKWGFQRTDVIRQHPFPIFEGEKHCMMSSAWSSIDRFYKTRFINDVIRIYYMHDDVNQTFTITKTTSAVRYPQSFATSVQGILNYELEWFRYAPITFIRTAGLYTRYALLAGWGFARQWRGLKSGRARLLWIATLPLGIAVYWRDRTRMK